MATPGEVDGQGLEAVLAPYLLSVSVKTSIDREGRRWIDELWAKDLLLHMEYLRDLTVAAPARRRDPGPTDVCLDSPAFAGLKVIDLPSIDNDLQAVLRLPSLLARLWKAVRTSSIVHTGFGGWPVAEGWVVAPMGKLLRKVVLTNVESSGWRAIPGAPWHRRARGAVMEALSRWAVKMADLRFFTSEAYAREFLPDTADRQYVVPAAWIDDESILDEAAWARCWEGRGGPPRLVFASRLTEQKGTRALLRAIDEASDAEIEITIIGEGEIAEECRSFAARPHGKVRVRFLDPVPYGEPFLALLREHDAVLVPSLSDEQPRVIFDAYSQGVPVLGSSTGGIGEVVTQGVTGLMTPPGDVEGLARTLRWASENRPELRRLGANAMDTARRFSHRRMHGVRHGIILSVLAGRARGVAGA